MMMMMMMMKMIIIIGLIIITVSAYLCSDPAVHCNFTTSQLHPGGRLTAIPASLHGVAELFKSPAITDTAG